MADYSDYGVNGTSSHIINWIYSNVDKVSENFIQNTYQMIVEQNMSTLLVLCSIYIAGKATLVYLGKMEATLDELLWSFFKLVIVLTFLRSYPFFDQYIYTFFVDGPNQIIASVISATTFKTVMGSDNLITSLSVFVDRVMSMISILWDIGWSGKLYAVITLLLSGFLVIRAGGWLVAIKAMCAVLLGLAPVFFSFLLFKPTQGMFEGWVRMLFTVFLMPLFLLTLLSFCLAMVQFPIVGLEQQIKDVQEGTVDLNIADILPFLITIGVCVFVFGQAHGIATSIAGGFMFPQLRTMTDRGMGQLGSELSQRWQKSGGVIGRLTSLQQRILRGGAKNEQA